MDFDDGRDRIFFELRDQIALLYFHPLRASTII